MEHVFISVPPADECDCPPGMCLGDTGEAETSGPFAPGAGFTGFQSGSLGMTSVGPADFTELDAYEDTFVSKQRTVAYLARAAENFGLALAGIARLAEEAFDE